MLRQIFPRRFLSSLGRSQAPLIAPKTSSNPLPTKVMDHPPPMHSDKAVPVINQQNHQLHWHLPSSQKPSDRTTTTEHPYITAKLAKLKQSNLPQDNFSIKDMAELRNDLKMARVPADHDVLVSEKEMMKYMDATLPPRDLLRVPILMNKPWVPYVIWMYCLSVALASAILTDWDALCEGQPHVFTKLQAWVAQKKLEFWDIPEEECEEAMKKKLQLANKS